MLDVKTCCRLCLYQRQQSLKDCGEDALVQTIKDIFGIELVANGPLSTKICRECILKVLDFNLYRTSVLNNQKSLEQYRILQDSFQLSPSQVKQENDDDVVFVNYERSTNSTNINTVQQNLTINEVSTPTAIAEKRPPDTTPVESPQTKKIKLRKLKVLCEPISAKEAAQFKLKDIDKQILKINGNGLNERGEVKNTLTPKMKQKHKVFENKSALKKKQEHINGMPKLTSGTKKGHHTGPKMTQEHKSDAANSKPKMKQCNKSTTKMKPDRKNAESKSTPASSGASHSKNLMVGTTSDSDDEDKEDEPPMTLKDFLDKYNKTTEKAPAASKITSTLPPSQKTSNVGLLTIQPQGSIGNNPPNYSSNVSNKNNITTTSVPEQTNSRGFISIVPNTLPSPGVLYKNVNVLQNTPPTPAKVNISIPSRPPPLQMCSGRSTKISAPINTKSITPKTSCPTNAPTPRSVIVKPPAVPVCITKNPDKSKISKLIIRNGQIFNEQGNCLANICNDLKNLHSKVHGAAPGQVTFKVSVEDAKKIEAAAIEQRAATVPNNKPLIPFPVQLISAQQPGRPATYVKLPAPNDTLTSPVLRPPTLAPPTLASPTLASPTLAPPTLAPATLADTSCGNLGPVDSTTDNRVKVLSVNELNMRANDTGARKLPIRITLVKIRDEVQIKLSDSKNFEIHYNDLSEQEQQAVKLSLIQPSSKAQITSAIKSCKPDEYTRKMLETLRISVSDLA